VINGGNWPAGLHCRPNNPINILFPQLPLLQITARTSNT
jgi:hypothetical protein